MQESFCKDVEHAYGILKSLYSIIRFPGQFWKHKDLLKIMSAVIILHNMSIEDESKSKIHGDWDYNQTPQKQAKITTNGPHNSTFKQFLL
jgi:hypothetical protein